MEFLLADSLLLLFEDDDEEEELLLLDDDELLDFSLTDLAASSFFCLHAALAAPAPFFLNEQTLMVRPFSSMPKA